MSSSAAVFHGHQLACERGGRVVFARLDFAVAAGELLVLRGPNGSGKSTLLRLMAGLTPALAGALSWGDGPALADRLRHQARLRYIGHQDAVKPALSLRENLESWRRLRPGGGPGDQEAADRALDRFGLLHLADLPARLLSAGQRRRLALARLAVAPAPLWLLDEPGTALDSDGSARLDRAIREHLAGGGRAVLSSHGDGAVAGRALDLAEFRAPAGGWPA
jgi:heme exporter protein A